MEIERIEFATELFFDMLKNHPELCPHRYEWDWSNAPKNGKQLRHYTCRICRKEFEEEVDVK